MGRPGEKRLGQAPLGRKRSWPAALLGASILLSSCFLLTQAQGGAELPVTWKPLNPIKGQIVTLRPGGNLENIVRCSWYRGRVTHWAKRILVYYQPPSPLGQINGPAHTGRETGGPDCSLHIRNLTSADSGNYTVEKDGALLYEIGHADIEVLDPVQEQKGFVIATTFIWIIIGSVAAILALTGALLYFFLCARRRRDRTSTQTITTPSFYKNPTPSGQVNPEKSSAVNNIYQVNPEKSSADNNIYQTLQPGSQSVYEELELRK